MTDPLGHEDGLVAPAGPIRVARLRARAVNGDRYYEPGQRGDCVEPLDANAAIEVLITARLEPACPIEEWPWWEKQLRDQGVHVGGGVISPTEREEIHLRVRPPDVQIAARSLLEALDAAAVGYPQNFELWRHERNQHIEAERLRRDESDPPYQAILDTLISDHRPDDRSTT